MDVIQWPEPAMVTNSEGEVLQVRLPPGVPAARFTRSRSSLTGPADTAGKPEGGAVLHLLTFPCAPLPTSICYFLSDKSFGQFQCCV